MGYGFIIPGMGDAGTNEIVELAGEAESAGWDAIVSWDADWAIVPG